MCVSGLGSYWKYFDATLGSKACGQGCQVSGKCPHQLHLKNHSNIFATSPKSQALDKVENSFLLFLLHRKYTEVQKHLCIACSLHQHFLLFLNVSLKSIIIKMKYSGKNDMGIIVQCILISSSSASMFHSSVVMCPANISNLSRM